MLTVKFNHERPAKSMHFDGTRTGMRPAPTKQSSKGRCFGVTTCRGVTQLPRKSCLTTSGTYQPT